MIVFVVVIYNMRPSDCLTLSTLRDSLRGTGMVYRILVLDNSATPADPAADDGAFDYVPFRENAGLARAYQHGVAYCRERGAEFMVTLDQDSSVTPAYIDAVLEHTNKYRGQQVALCPQIFCGARQVSPFSFSALGMPRYGGHGHLHAINSFSVYSVASLAVPGTIDEFYWLDALDFAIFGNLHRRGVPVVAMQVEVQHSLSLLAEGVRHGRLANMAFYEAAFLFEYCGPLRSLSGLSRLLVRVARRTDFRRRNNGFGALLGALTSGSVKGISRRLGRRPVAGAQACD